MTNIWLCKFILKSFQVVVCVALKVLAFEDRDLRKESY